MNHQDYDARSRVLHRMAAEKLRNDPKFYGECVERIHDWRGKWSVRSIPYLDSWQAAFDEGIERVCEIALGTSEWCDAMRQCSPMGFIFSSEKERQHFLRHWRTM
jgi:hypothetical protein